MKNNKTQINTPPYLKYSLLSFQEYCNRDIFNQHALLYSHQHNLYTNARNRRKVQLHARHPSFFKKESTCHQLQSGRLPANTDNQSTRQKLVKTRRSEILNVTPAVIHTTNCNRMSLTLSQRARTEMKEVSRSKVQKCKTVNFDWNSEGNSIVLNNHNSPHYVIRPRTAGQKAAGLNKIKVYLPFRPHSSKFKEEAINPWDSYEDQGT